MVAYNLFGGGATFAAIIVLSSWGSQWVLLEC